MVNKHDAERRYHAHITPYNPHIPSQSLYAPRLIIPLIFSPLLRISLSILHVQQPGNVSHERIALHHSQTATQSDTEVIPIYPITNHESQLPYPHESKNTSRHSLIHRRATSTANHWGSSSTRAVTQTSPRARIMGSRHPALYKSQICRPFSLFLFLVLHQQTFMSIHHSVMHAIMQYLGPPHISIAMDSVSATELMAAPLFMSQGKQASRSTTSIPLLFLSCLCYSTSVANNIFIFKDYYMVAGTTLRVYCHRQGYTWHSSPRITHPAVCTTEYSSTLQLVNLVWYTKPTPLLPSTSFYIFNI